MIRDESEFRSSRRRLLKLQSRAESIVTDPQKSRRVKDMELAGVHSMINQLQQEIRAYELAQIQCTIHDLKSELQDADVASLPFVIQKTLDVLEEMTRVLQPALNP